MYLDSVNLDSHIGLSYAIVNAGPLFGSVVVCGQGNCNSAFVSQWSNVSIVLSPIATSSVFTSTTKATAQYVYIAQLDDVPSTITQTMQGGAVLNVPADVNPWDNVVTLSGVYTNRAAVSPDTLVAYPTSSPTTFVAAIGVTNLGNVPWLVVGVPSIVSFALVAAGSSFSPLLACDTAACGLQRSYWCTGSLVGQTPATVNPGETCYAYFVDSAPMAAQAFSSYIVAAPFTTSGITLGPDSSPFGISALLMAPYTQPTPVASGYTTWTPNVPGPQQYNGYLGHYAMWRSHADPLGQPLVVLALGSPVLYESTVTNVSMFLATESGACQNICSNSTESQCSAYATQCFSANTPRVSAAIKLLLWRPVDPQNATYLHLGDFQLVASQEFQVGLAGHFTRQAVVDGFSW